MAGVHRPPRRVPSRPVLEQQADGLADEFRRGVAELVARRRVGGLDHAVGVERQDRIGRAADDRVVARVLPCAQNALAIGPVGDVDDLDEAMGIGLVADRPNGHVVHELHAGARLQRQQRGVQSVREQTGGAGSDGVRDGFLQSRQTGHRKHVVQPAPHGRLGLAATRRLHPGVPSGDPAVAGHDNEASVHTVENVAQQIVSGTTAVMRIAFRRRHRNSTISRRSSSL